MAKQWVCEVKGIKPFRKKLKRLPKTIQKRVVKSAVTRAGAIVRMKAKDLVKKNAIDDGLPNGHLFKEIISKTSMHKGVPVSTVGAEYTRGSVAHFVYQGTKPHTITVPKEKGSLFSRQLKIRHPGGKAYPFMKLALEQSHEKSEREMVKKLAEGIEQNLKTK